MLWLYRHRYVIHIFISSATVLGRNPHMLWNHLSDWWCAWRSRQNTNKSNKNWFIRRERFVYRGLVLQHGYLSRNSFLECQHSTTAGHSRRRLLSKSSLFLVTGFQIYCTDHSEPSTVIAGQINVCGSCLIFIWHLSFSLKQLEMFSSPHNLAGLLRGQLL